MNASSPPYLGTSAEHLRTRLIQTHALEESDRFDRAIARAAIVGARLDAGEGFVCDLVAGRRATYAQYFALCFGETLAGKPWQPKAKRAANQS